MIIVAPTNINYLLPKGDLLKARRMELGLTQDDLAEKSTVSKNTISAYERNASRATPSSAKALAEALDMELVDLFEYPAAVEEVDEVDESYDDDDDADGQQGVSGSRIAYLECCIHISEIGFIQWGQLQ